MQLVREPDTDAALEFLRTELQGLQQHKGRLVQVIAECSVAYQGRARSMLHRGERILILKPDGTFLVHTASKAKPVNWQPPGAVFDVALEDDVLTMTAYRAKPEEIVKVTFHEVSLLLAAPLRDAEELALVGSEDDLQALLFAHPELVEEGFVPRRRERDTKRGFYDLDGDDADGNRLIVEVKRGTAGVKEATQLWRYVEELRGSGDPARIEVAAGSGGKRAGKTAKTAAKGTATGKDGEAAPAGGGNGRDPRTSRQEESDKEPGAGKNSKVRGILIAPRVADKARGILRDHGLQWKELDWDEVLPKVERMRRTGQVGLGRFG